MNNQLALSIQLNEEARLNDFFWGNNQLLQQQLDKTLKNTGERFIYIWGGLGCGKSYLLQSCCQAISNHKSAMYLPLRILKGYGPSIIEGISEQDLICIDDIDCIAQDSKWEEALFHLYNNAKDLEKIMIIAGSQPPPQLGLVLPDLTSRLSWGLVFQLLELNDEGKINTIKNQALKRGFDLPLGVAQFLITRCTRNMHDLNNLLQRLDEASLRAQRKITIPFVKHILGL